MLEGLAKALAVKFAVKLAWVLVNVDVDLVRGSTSRSIEDTEFAPSPARKFE